MNFNLYNNEFIDLARSGKRNSHVVWVILFPFLLMFVVQIILGITLGIYLVLTGNLSQDRILSFSSSPFSLLIVTLLNMIICFLWVRFFEGRKISTMGFQRNNSLSQYLLGFILGCILISIISVLILLLSKVNISYGNLSATTILQFIFVFIAWLVQGASEEVIIRGFALQAISKRYNVITGVIISSILFSSLHIFNSGINLLSIINLFLFGIFAAIFTLYFESLWGICALHSAWNFAQGNIFGYLVSGNNAPGPKFLEISYSVHDIINGGNFGPEGGIITSIILTISIITFIKLLNIKSKNISLKK